MFCGLIFILLYFVDYVLDEIILERNPEEKSKLIQIIAADKEHEPGNKEHLERTTLTKKYSNEKARTWITHIHTGTPSTYGIPSTTSIINTITPQVSQAMTSATGTPYIDVSLMGAINSNSISNYAGNAITIMGTDPLIGIERNIHITCAPGRDCSIYNDELNKINNPTVSISAVDNQGNPISQERSYSLDPNDFNPDISESKRTPDIISIKINSQETSSIEQGTGAFNLTIEGSMFNTTTYIIWNNQELETNYVSDKKLIAFVPAYFTNIAQRAKIKVRKYLNNKNKLLESEAKDFEVKSNSKGVSEFDTSTDLEKTILGNDLSLLRSGNDVYIDNKTTVFKGAGDISFIFKTNEESSLNLDIIGSLINVSSIPSLKLYFDGTQITTLTSASKCFGFNGAWSCTKNNKWSSNLGTLKPGVHVLKLSLPENNGTSIFILDNLNFKLTQETIPSVTSVNPLSIYPSNTNNRKIEIIGNHFGANPKVNYIDRNKTLQAELDTNNKNKIIVTLPQDLELQANQQFVSLNVVNPETNKASKAFSVNLRSELKISSLKADYKFNSIGPSANLTVNISTSTNDTTNVLIGVFDKYGKVIVNPYSEGRIKNTNDEQNYKTSFLLPYDLLPGKYQVLTLLERKIPGSQTDHSDYTMKKILDDLVQNKITTESEFSNRLALLSQSHKAEFEITPKIIPIVKLTGVYTNNGNNIVQENQEVIASIELKGNIADKSTLKIKTNFGDGTELIGESIKHTYKLLSGTKEQFFNVTTKVFSNEIEIGSSEETQKGFGITVYKDLPPIAVAKIDTENYEYVGDALLKSGFIDRSYDPNDELTNFSGTLDKTLPEKNIWKLFKYKDGITGQFINSEDLSITNNQILNHGKSFVTSPIITPGTYYAQLTVFDQGNNSDTTQSETIQVLLPTQMLLVHASIEQSGVYEYDSDGKVKVQFNSLIQIRGNKQPKNIIYKWDFGDDSVIARNETTKQSSNETSETTQPNPIHIYKRSEINRDRISYHPELTVTALWTNGYSETWSSKAGTVSIIDKPELVALDLVPDSTIGNLPLTINFMLSDKSYVKNSTIVSYSFDFGDGDKVSEEIGETGNPDAALAELKQKIFTHTYTTKGKFNPILKVKTKENPNKEYTFNSPIISTNSLLVSAIEVLDPLDNFITNQPIQTLIINSIYTNPFSDQNRLTIHIIDEENLDKNETITELNPDSTSQTISLSEGVNTYWFELIDSTGAIQKSLARKIILDTVNPSLELFSPGNEEIIKNGTLKIFGITSDENLDRIEYQLDNNPPINILQDETKIIDEKNLIFLKEISNPVKGSHRLTVRAIDKAQNTAEESFDVGVGEGVFTFDKLLSFRGSSPVRTFSGGNYKANIGEPFKIQKSIWFYGDTTGKNDPYVDLSLSATGFYNGTQEDISNLLFNTNKEIFQTHFNFTLGDIDGFALSPTIVYKSTSLNQLNFDNLYDLVKNKNINNAWDVGTHNIEISTSTTSPSGGVSIADTNNINDYSNKITNQYVIDIQRPISIKRILEPKIAKLNENTTFITKVEVTDPLTFNSTTRKLKLLLDQATLKKQKGSQAQIENLNIIPGSEEIDQKNSKIAKAKIIFNLRPDILPIKDDSYKLIIPIELAPDNDHPDGKKDEKIEIAVPVRGIFQAIIEKPNEGEIVTREGLVSARLKGAAENISKFENQNVEFALSKDGGDPVKIEANLGAEQIFRVNKFQKLGEDIIYNTKVRFDLHKVENFKELFLSQDIFGPIDIFSTYTNIKDNTTFNGDKHTLILIDDPQLLIQQTILKKEKENVALRLTLSNNTVLNKSDELLVKLTPYKSGEEIITSLDETILNQKFSFTNQEGNPKLTETRKILLPAETQKVKVEIQRSDMFLNNIKAKLQEEWKDNFIDKVRQEEKSNRTYIITLNQSLKADCEVINELITKRFTNTKEIEALGIIAGCKKEEKIFFNETSKESDTINLPFVNDGTANIPDDTTLDIKSINFPFRDQLTLDEFKQLLKDLKLLRKDNNNGYDLETEEAIYELLNIIDELRCALAAKSNVSLNLKQQVIEGALKCGISTSNYQEYISSSIKQDLPLVVSLIELSKTLKEIGTQSPIANIDLPDSLLLRAIAIPTLPGRLLPWQLQLIGAAGLIVYNALANSKLKVETKDTTCKRTFGIIDRRFIIGKDLNNLDIKRTNTMVGIQLEGYTFNPKIVEPFPHIPFQGGLYYACLPEGTYNFQLQFNGQNTFSMSVTIPSSLNINILEPFIGSVFRKYGKKSVIPKIVESKTILSSTEGDVKSLLNPAGVGAYITNLSLTPNIDTPLSQIAEVLRLYTSGTFEIGNPNSKGEPDASRAESFIDLAVKTNEISLDHNNDFPLQFVLPGSPINFGYPGEQSQFILIDKFGVP